MRSVESYLAVRRAEQSLEIDLTGEWRALELPRIDAALAAVDLTNTRRVVIRTEGLASLDLSGAWRLRDFLQQLRQAGTDVEFQGPQPDQLRLVDTTLKGEAPLPPCR